MKVDQIQKDIQSKVNVALDASGEDIKHLFKDVLYRDFYNVYKPVEYIRTEQIKNAIQKTPAVSSGTGSSVEVFYDEGVMKHPRPYAVGQSGVSHYVDYSELEILIATMSGYHMVGVTGKGAKTDNTWFNTLAEFDKQKHSIISKQLKAAGLPIH